MTDRGAVGETRSIGLSTLWFVPTWSGSSRYRGALNR